MMLNSISKELKYLPFFCQYIQVYMYYEYTLEVPRPGALNEYPNMFFMEK